jgi:hypothetical protein
MRMTGASSSSFDKQRSSACELVRLEYPLLACARDDAQYGCVYETSTDVYLVARPAGRLSSCINQGGFAVTQHDTPAWRPGHIDVDEAFDADCGADRGADYQAVC